MSARNSICMLVTAFVLFVATASAQEQPRPHFDPARFEAAISAFEQAHAATPEPEGGIVVIGSSSIRFWRSIKDDLAPLTIVHRGFGGSTMKDALHYMDRIVIPHKPRAVLLYEGDNDLSAFRVTPAVVMENFNAFAARLHAALPQTRLYLLSIKPSIARWDDWPLVAQTNAQLQRRCAELAYCTYIDVATPMLATDGKPKPELFVEDLLHMTAAGYAIWTDAIKPVLMHNESRHEGKR